MQVAISAVRANQKSAIGLSGGLFTGVVAITAILADFKNLKFYANITYQTGDVGAPQKTFTPCTDNGEVKKFSAIDDIIKWVNGAFLDVTDISIEVDSADLIAKKFVAPTDPVANATKQKAAFTKLKDGIQDNKAFAQANVNAAVASGWDVSANPALLAAYAKVNASLQAVLAIETYYTDQIEFWDGVANP